ncbi:MAG: hypothetical protein ACPGWR_13840 [Ardenticatenaceae bacterium]
MIILILLGVLIVGLICLAGLGLSFTPKLTIPPLDWWGHPMPNNLRAYLKKQVDDRDFTIHYYMGGGLGGETSFYLFGDGRYELWSTVTRGHQRKIYSGQVPLSQVEQVVQEMLSVKIWRVRHDPSSRWLDDPRAMVSLKARGQKSIVMLWVSEIRESPPFIAVQRPMLALIRHISKGEVLENGRGTNQVAPQVEQGGRFRRNFDYIASFLRGLKSKRVKSQPISLKSDLRQREEASER